MAHRTLLFDIELISVVTGKQAKSTPTEKAKE
jgi:hypothetical protein